MTNVLSIYCRPLNFDLSGYKKDQIGGHIVANIEGGDFPEIEQGEVFIIGVSDDRGSALNKGTELGADKIRHQLYALYMKGPKLVDLGNILPGKTIEDTYFAVQESISLLIKSNKTVILLGGGQDLTYAAYKGYEHTEQLINLVCVDYRFDLGQNSDEPITNLNYLNNILLHQPNFLFNFANIGYQTYFTSPEVIGLMEKLFFDALRLGVLRSDIKQVEPLVRNADLLSFDVSAIQAASAPGSGLVTPNGLRPDEACQVTRYAGLSDKSSCIGFFEYNPSFDANNQTALLIAEMIWYFLDGFKNRKDEIPLDLENKFVKYRVPVSEFEEELLFYKSIRTDRWWMHVPYPGKKENRYRRHNLVPCDYGDYLKACEDDVPDLWLKTYRKYL